MLVSVSLKNVFTEKSSSIKLLLEYSKFAALAGLIPGFFGFFVCGFLGAIGVGETLFNLPHWAWYQGLVIGCLFGLFMPIITSFIASIVIAFLAGALF
jgi:hypothetical protein